MTVSLSGVPTQGPPAGVALAIVGLGLASVVAAAVLGQGSGPPVPSPSAASITVTAASPEAVKAPSLTAPPTPTPSVARRCPASNYEQPSLSPDGSPSAAGGIVSVTVSTIHLPEGFCLAAILGRASPGIVGFGGFAVPVPAGSSTATETVREGTPLVGTLSGGRPVAIIPPGTYTLWLWVSSDLRPYGEWLPAEPVEFGCQTDITVALGRRTNVFVADIPAWGGGGPCGPKN